MTKVNFTYELLSYSQTLEEFVEAMTRWGMQHREKIKTQRSCGMP